MCSVCGCGEGDTKIDGAAHGHHHGQGQRHHYSRVPAEGSRVLRIEQDILARNDAHAAGNRRFFAEHGIFVLNLVSSPGSGKTALLTRTISTLGDKVSVAVIEGDQQTSLDADRIRATGTAAVQINTGKGCHLDAHMVGHGLERLAIADDSLLLIENVGNLVCPAAFDLGEAHKVVILSVTEGEDKPLKYPDMFAAADVMLLNKVDLLPHLNFNVPLCIEYARRVNPNIQVMLVSTVNGEGMAEWLEWIQAGLRQAGEQKSREVDALKRRIAALEEELAAARGG